jgi:tetrapyrrole methylase family protein / MazG family protein
MESRRPTFQDLVAIMARLRGPGGCPWDRAQTHSSLRPYLLEEAYETLDAIDDRAPGRLQEELGDLLLQVVFHAQMAEDAGQFTIDDVVAGLADKLVRRHPHVFGDASASSPDAVVARWEEIKKEERTQAQAARTAAAHAPAEHHQDGQREAGSETPRHGALDGLPRTLPALALAQQIQARAVQAGFAWPDLAGAIRKTREELDELEHAAGADHPDRIGEELGDFLLAAAGLPRYFSQNGELVLRGACAKFTDRFARMEDRARAAGRALHEYTPDELLTLWRASR